MLNKHEGINDIKTFKHGILPQTYYNIYIMEIHHTASFYINTPAKTKSTVTYEVVLLCWYKVCLH